MYLTCVYYYELYRFCVVIMFVFLLLGRPTLVGKALSFTH